MSIKLTKWDPTSNYKAGDRVIFYDKIYVALKDNKMILPIPVVDDEDKSNSNYDVISKIASNYYDDIDNIDMHLNTQEVKAWLLV